MELLQRSARLDPELLNELAAPLAEGGQSLGLAARTVKGEHQLSAQAFVQPVCGHERLQLADEGCMPAQCQIGIDPVPERLQPLLL